VSLECSFRGDFEGVDEPLGGFGDVPELFAGDDAKELGVDVVGRANQDGFGPPGGQVQVHGRHCGREGPDEAEGEQRFHESSLRGPGGRPDSL